jgi:small subunit ribosomal protein S8
MSQDIISDSLNQIMNAKRAKKDTVVLEKSSQLLIKVLDMMKDFGYIAFEKDDKKIKIAIKELNHCKSIKPRYTVSKDKIDFYSRRFLPARNFGYLIVSTNKGLMTHTEATENKLGGCLIAYFY